MEKSTILKQATVLAKDFCKFVNASPSPHHAVENLRNMLRASKFCEIKENDVWKLKDSGKYFLTRNNTSIVAFALGGKFDKTKNDFGFKVIGTHTDSPNLRLNPVSKLKS